MDDADCSQTDFKDLLTNLQTTAAESRVMPYSVDCESDGIDSMPTVAATELDETITSHNQNSGLEDARPYPHMTIDVIDTTVPMWSQLQTQCPPNTQTNLRTFGTCEATDQIDEPFLSIFQTKTNDTEEVENMEIEAIQPSADQKCLIGVSLLRNIKKYELVDSKQDDVIKIIKHAVVCFLTMIINQMVELKRKYTFICPTLTGDGISSKKNDKVECQEVYDQSPFTAEDLFLCFKEMSYNFPVKSIYDLAMRHILEKKNKIKEEENTMKVEAFGNDSEDEAYSLEDWYDCS